MMYTKIKEKTQSLALGLGKKGKKIMFATAVIASIATPQLVANASTAQNTNILVELNASRPALSGSPRGKSTITTRNANSQAIRTRTVVVNTNGTTTTPNIWATTEALAGANYSLPRGRSITSRETIGSTRGGTVHGQGQRRATQTGAWSATISALQSF